MNIRNLTPHPVISILVLLDEKVGPYRMKNWLAACAVSILVLLDEKVGPLNNYTLIFSFSPIYPCFAG